MDDMLILSQELKQHRKDLLVTEDASMQQSII